MLGQLPGDQLTGGGHQVLLAGLLLELHLEQVAEVLLGGELEAGLHVGGLFRTFLPDVTSRRLIICDILINRLREVSHKNAIKLFIF
jgi:hypothetical protein